MSVQQQEQPVSQGPTFYAYCARPDCGVCGPIRGSAREADADAKAHERVCSARLRPPGAHLPSP